MAAGYVQHANAGIDNGSTTTPVTPTLGSTPTDGNVLVAICAWNYSASREISASGGWTQRGEEISGGSNAIRVFTKVASSDGTTPFTATPATNFTDIQVCLVEVSGALNPASGFDTPSSDSSQSADPPYNAAATTLTCPSQTVSVSDSIVFAVGSSNTNEASTTPPSGYTEICDASPSGGVGMCVAYKTGVASGATGGLAITAYGATFWTSNWVSCMTFNVQPSGSGGVANSFYYQRNQ